jgi:hypothetical protein
LVSLGVSSSPDYVALANIIPLLLAHLDVDKSPSDFFSMVLPKEKANLGIC